MKNCNIPFTNNKHLKMFNWWTKQHTNAKPFLPIIIVDLQQQICKSNDLILAKLVFVDCETYRYFRDPKHIRGLGYGEQRQKIVLQGLNSCPWQYHSVWSPHLQCNHYTPAMAAIYEELGRERDEDLLPDGLTSTLNLLSGVTIPYTWSSYKSSIW